MKWFPGDLKDAWNSWFFVHHNSIAINLHKTQKRNKTIAIRQNGDSYHHGNGMTVSLHVNKNNGFIVYHKLK